MSARILLFALALALGGAGCVIEYTVPAESGADDHESTGEGTIDDDGGSTCAAGRDACGRACFDLRSDPEHCGSCDHACGPADVCDAGECVAECGDGRVACSRACVDLSSDPFHCGECTETCDLDGACVAGDCVDACGDTCDGTTEVCTNGECECRSGFFDCGGACVDVDTNPAHCGACDRGCDGLPCGDGECQAAGCDGFADQCGESCTDVSNDPLHCRECGRTCDGDEICVDGDCEDLD